MVFEKSKSLIPTYLILCFYLNKVYVLYCFKNKLQLLIKQVLVNVLRIQQTIFVGIKVTFIFD